MIGYPKITIDMDDPDEKWDVAYETIRTGKPVQPEPPDPNPTTARATLQDLIDSALRVLKSMADDRE